MGYSLLIDPPTEERPCTFGEENTQQTLLPVKIKPDEGVAGVIGDTVPSNNGVTGEKHFVSPKKSSEITNDYVTLKAEGPTVELFESLLVWEGGEAVPNEPLKRRIKRDTTGKTVTKVKVRNAGPEVDRMNVWVIWTIMTANLTGNNLHPNNHVLIGQDTTMTQLGENVVTETMTTTLPGFNVRDTRKYFVHGIEWRAELRPSEISNIYDDIPSMEDEWNVNRERIRKFYVDGELLPERSDTTWTNDDISDEGDDLNPYEGPRNNLSGDPTGDIFSTDSPGILYSYSEDLDTGEISENSVFTGKLSVSHNQNFREFSEVDLNGKVFGISNIELWHSFMTIQRASTEERNWSFQLSDFGLGNK